MWHPFHLSVNFFICLCVCHWQYNEKVLHGVEILVAICLAAVLESHWRVYCWINIFRIGHFALQIHSYHFNLLFMPLYEMYNLFVDINVWSSRLDSLIPGSKIGQKVIRDELWFLNYVLLRTPWKAELGSCFMLDHKVICFVLSWHIEWT